MSVTVGNNARSSSNSNVMIFTLGKGIVHSLTQGSGDPSTIFSLNMEGTSVLQCAACSGHLEVCKYLVEELGGDVNAPETGAGVPGLSLTHFLFWKLVAVMILFGSMRFLIVLMCFLYNKGVTPFMVSAQSGDVPTVKYLLDHGGDLMKADGKGQTVLHHAAFAGALPDTCTQTQFLHFGPCTNNYLP